jgi:hypothetical protein
LNCRECEEQVAAWSRDAEREPGPPALSRAAAAHLAQCRACREFSEEAQQATAVLAAWQLPALRPAAAEKEALVARLAALCAPGRGVEAGPAAGWEGLPSRSTEGGLAGRIGRHPALLGLLGAAAAGAGAAAAPGWFQQVVIGWAAGAAMLASLVLLFHGRSQIMHGERL